MKKNIIMILTSDAISKILQYLMKNLKSALILRLKTTVLFLQQNVQFS